MEKYGLFPTAVFKYVIGKPKQTELSFIEDLPTTKNVGNSTSIDHYVLDNNNLESLNNKIMGCVEDYFKCASKPKQNLNLSITQSWCNYTEEKEYHHEHYHANSVVSGVYYPKAEHAEDRIYFYNPLHQHKSLSPYHIDATHEDEWNALSWWLPVTTGDLIIFPSYLNHRVGSIDTRETTRISLSFNTFFKGELGAENGLSRLVL